MSEPSQNRDYQINAGLERVNGCMSWFALHVMAPLLIVLSFVGISMETASHWNAYLDRGTRGTFTAVTADCHNSSCSWSGDFVGTDGRDVRHDVWMESPLLHRPGDRAPALDTGTLSQMFSPSGDSGWEQTALFSALMTTFTALWVWRVPYRAWRRRLARRAFAPAE